MRPLQLNVRGLHSFRDEQTIDFNQLCDGGVFGIFGPTGSGKSSILDAMTFALYGKISRSGSVGASIVNQSETEVAVSFSFRLGDRTFIAERRAKRKDTTLQTTRARFIETTEEPVVLADKKGAMDREIETMIGLKIEDFTRAVVLPQNKFSEFLSLKGAERSKMLQRLFDLGKYGDDLNEKIKKRLTEESAKKGEIEGEQSGLGDASEAALTKAKQEIARVETTLHKEETAKHELEIKWKESKEIRKQQEIHQELKSELETLAKEQPNHEKRLQALLISSIANQLLPYREEQERTEHGWKEAEKALENSQKQAETLAEKESETQNFYREARENRQAEEPQLTVKIAQLEEAQTLETELKTLSENMKDAREKETKLRKDQETADYDLQHTQKEEMNAKQQLYEKEEQLSALEKEQSNRENIRLAFEKKETLNQQKERLAEEKDTEQKAVERLKQQEAYRNEEYAQKEQTIAQLKTAQNNLYHWFFDLSEAKREQRSLIAAIKDMQAKAIDGNEAEIIQKLVHQLEEGKPCAVCGAIHHPKPTHASEQNAYDTEGLEKAGERLQAEDRIKHYHWSLEHYSQQIAAILEETQIHTPETAEDDPSHPTLESGMTPEKLNRKAEHFLQKLDAKATSLDTLVTNTKKLIEQMQQQITNLKEIDALYNQTMINRNEAATKRQRQEEIYDRRKQEWHESFPGLVLETIHEAWEASKKEQAQLEKLREEVRHQQQNLEFIREKINEAKNRHTDIQISLLQQEARREQLEKEHQQGEAKLKERVGENTTATNALADVRNTLLRLRENEKTAEETLNKTIAERQKTEQMKAAAQEQLTSSRKHHETANERWEQKRNTDEGKEIEKFLQGTLDSSTLRTHCLSAEKKNEYDALTQRFETQLAQTKKRLSEVEETLDGKQMTEEEWKALDDAFRQKEKEVETRREERSVARSKWEELKDKHHRYEKLEEERKKLQTTISHLKELERVFKGKAFVNFIAEEQLVQVTRHASERLHALTQGRYALALDSDNNFLIADYFNGGQKRPTSTLSGGETFLTSLALALSLSVSIQLRGQYPLEFFFLDEGFGTLDAELLDTVVNALEQLQTDHLAVGVISHVPELQERLHKRLLVEAPKPDGQGSRLTITS
ncbi:SbcC/MukB-like Walker B domain-containing protein [Salicibibacter kimchii]|uniref:Nuclease SbcCD subunit C n=1 Tax=Salicibibacter kimchii TaxID=2099786 RepID=A0A345BVH8_9BACI|nr:SMC family ATPase [Salicibibacter kimchii]AXF54959.1 SMC family ATPase [Salicibibacter kimchii]